jgi:Glycosyl hydrolases family 38 N-terminal domain
MKKFFASCAISLVSTAQATLTTDTSTHHLSDVTL